MPPRTSPAQSAQLVPQEGRGWSKADLLAALNAFRSYATAEVDQGLGRRQCSHSTGQKRLIPASGAEVFGGELPHYTELMKACHVGLELTHSCPEFVARHFQEAREEALARLEAHALRESMLHA